MQFKSPTYGTVKDIEEVTAKVFNRILTNKTSQWTIAIGTDSQNKQDQTRFCSAILLLEKGKGGIYFYTTQMKERFHTIQHRMLKEAELSIELGKSVIDNLEDKMLSDEFIELDLDISFEIHCDLGHDGKSRDSIKAAIGWITSEFGGLVAAKIKPNSMAASCIADKYTK